MVLKQPRRPADHPLMKRVRRYDTSWPTERLALSGREFEALYAPPAAAVRAILAEAKTYGMSVVDVSRARQDIVFEASIGAVERAYRVEMYNYRHERGQYHGHAGPVHMARHLVPLVHGVLGLDSIPHARPHARPARGRPIAIDQLAEWYRFPEAGPVATRIAMLEFGGGIHARDLRALRRRATIRVREITDGEGHRPGNSPLESRTLLAILNAWRRGVSFEKLADRWGVDLLNFVDTVEATMDAEIVSGLLPGAAVDLVFTAPSADGWRRAIYAALGYPYPGSVSGAGLRTRTPAGVIAISWGMAESGWGPMKLRIIQEAVRAAGRLGTTVCCSTGDLGSRNSSAAVTQMSVNFPASAPSVLACGGTSFREETAGRREVVWRESMLGSPMASGGGMSGHFPSPGYQSAIRKPRSGNTWLAGSRRSFRGRWIPDVAAHASFDPGIAIRLLGRPFAGGGTSAATPIWAALVARLSGRLRRPLGWLNPAFYQLKHRGWFRDIREGHNDIGAGTGKPRYFKAVVGWDPCTGLGAADGADLLIALEAGGPVKASVAAQ